jgi:hypothetical protein
MKLNIDILHERMPDHVASFCLSLEEEIRSYPFGRGLKLEFTYDKAAGCLEFKITASYVIESLSSSVANMISAEIIASLKDIDLQKQVCQHALSNLALARMSNEVPKVS